MKYKKNNLKTEISKRNAAAKSKKTVNFVFQLLKDNTLLHGKKIGTLHNQKTNPNLVINKEREEGNAFWIQEAKKKLYLNNNEIEQVKMLLRKGNVKQKSFSGIHREKNGKLSVNERKTLLENLQKYREYESINAILQHFGKATNATGRPTRDQQSSRAGQALQEKHPPRPPEVPEKIRRRRPGYPP